jgi:Peptidase family M23
MATATALSSVYGQGVVGQNVPVPWLNPAGPYEIMQGYGPTSVTREPFEDKQGKHQRWHSGVDIGCGTNTHLVFPHGVGQQATVIYLDNPAGYGTALILRMWTQSAGGHAGGGAQVRNADIYFGHLATRLVKNGATVREGDVLALTDSSGNSTGPHLHFEVRPPDGKFGTDLDPSQWLLQGNAAFQMPDLNPLDAVGAAITSAEKSLMNTLVGLAQTALGGSMMLAGGVTVGFGLRGMSPAQARSSTGGTLRRLNTKRVEPQREASAGPQSAAERTRLRPTLRREVGAGAGPEPAVPLSSLSGSRQPTVRSEARGMVATRYGVPVGRAESIRLRRALPLKRAS